MRKLATSAKGWLIKMYQEFSQLNNKMNSPIFLKKGAKDLNIQFTKEDEHIGSKHMKRCSASFVVRKMQIKTKIRYHYTLSEWPK